MKFSNLLIIGLLSGLFLFGMISISEGLRTDNGGRVSVLNNTAFNSTYNNLVGNLSAVQSTAQNQTENIEQQNPIIGTDALIIPSIFGAFKTFRAILVGFFNIFFGTVANVLGVSPVALGVFSCIVIVIALFAIYRAVRIGE